MKFITLIALLGFCENVLAFEIEVQILKTIGKGTISCALFSSENGFPMENEKASQVVKAVRSDSQKAICKFSNVSSANYAVSVSEDLNDNGKTDTTFVGYPKEPWGVSNDAPMRTFGPPKFKTAQIEVKSDLEITINLNQK